MPHLRSAAARKRRRSCREQYIPWVATSAHLDKRVRLCAVDMPSPHLHPPVNDQKFVTQDDFEALLKYQADLQAHLFAQNTVLLQRLESWVLKLHEACTHTIASLRVRVDELEALLPSVTSAMKNAAVAVPELTPDPPVESVVGHVFYELALPWERLQTLLASGPAVTSSSSACTSSPTSTPSRRDIWHSFERTSNVLEVMEAACSWIDFDWDMSILPQRLSALQLGFISAVERLVPETLMQRCRQSLQSTTSLQAGNLQCLRDFGDYADEIFDLLAMHDDGTLGIASENFA